MDELTIGDKIYISSKRAATITGYAKDYIGQLCREGRVEATLVGRSWYVLESSIRAHRFGSEASQQEQKAPREEEPEVLRTWESPRYEPESSQPVPPISPRSVNMLNRQEADHAEEAVSAPAVPPETVDDMQAAWREWFATRQQLPVPESTQDEESADAQDAEIEQVEEPEEESPWVDTVESENEESEEPVFINRTGETYAATPVYDPVPSTPEVEEEVHVRRNYADHVREEQSYAPRIEAQPQIRTRIVAPSRPRKKGRGSSGLALKTALLVLAAFAVIIAAIGSGVADAYMRKAGIEYSLIRFFSGASILDK